MEVFIRTSIILMCKFVIILLSVLIIIFFVLLLKYLRHKDTVDNDNIEFDDNRIEKKKMLDFFGLIYKLRFKATDKPLLKRDIKIDLKDLDLKDLEKSIEIKQTLTLELIEKEIKQIDQKVDELKVVEEHLEEELIEMEDLVEEVIEHQEEKVQENTPVKKQENNIPKEEQKITGVKIPYEEDLLQLKQMIKEALTLKELKKCKKKFAKLEKAKIYNRLLYSEVEKELILKSKKIEDRYKANNKNNLPTINSFVNVEKSNIENKPIASTVNSTDEKKKEEKKKKQEKLREVKETIKMEEAQQIPLIASLCYTSVQIFNAITERKKIQQRQGRNIQTPTIPRGKLDVYKKPKKETVLNRISKFIIQTVYLPFRLIRLERMQRLEKERLRRIKREAELEKLRLSRRKLEKKTNVSIDKPKIKTLFNKKKKKKVNN